VRSDFDRRFGGWWLGLDAAEARKLARTLYEPLSGTEKKTRNADYWRGGRNATRLLWMTPKRVLPEWVLRTPQPLEKATVLAQRMNAAEAEIAAIAKRVKYNPLTLRAARLGFAMLRYAAHKPLRLHDAATLYAQQRKGPMNAAGLNRIAEVFTGLSEEARTCAVEYGFFVDHCGAYKGDADGLRAQAKELANSAKAFADLAKKVEAGAMKTLPSAATFGLIAGQAVRLGEWTPKTISDKGAVLHFPLSPERLKGVTGVQVSWEFTHGAHGLAIRSCRLVCDGKTVDEDRHAGWAGSGSNGNTYTLSVKGTPRDGNWEIVADVISRGGTDSRGEVWLVLPDSTQ